MTKVWSIYEEDGSGDHRINFFETLDELMGALDELIDYEENLDRLTHYVDLSVLIKELHTIQCASANLNDSLRKWIENYLEQGDKERDNLSTEIRLVGKKKGQLYLIKREDLQPIDGDVLDDVGDSDEIPIIGRQYFISVYEAYLEVYDIHDGIRRLISRLAFPSDSNFVICMETLNNIPRGLFKIYQEGERPDLDLKDSNIFYYEQLFDMLQCKTQEIQNKLKFESKINKNIIIFAPGDVGGYMI